MICPSCGTENRVGRRFCGQCGSALSRLCPSCQAANEANERFCGECGSSLESATRDATQPSVALTGVVAERRHVSVVFADLVGFTSLSDLRDAEEVRELLSRYFDAARTVITRYGGTVEKFIGDAVMAVWGVPTAQEDDAERAVRAALELVDAVAAFGQEVNAPELRARAGVLTGEAAVNLGATGEGMVAGDLVNTASRLQALADPGTVYVGDDTRRATEAAIEYEDVGPRDLKGKPEPVQLWRARRVVAGRGGVMRPTGLEPPFVGRDRELRLLKEFLHATSEEGKARFLSIVGIAGVGKSRLAWEFEKYADGLDETMYWHRGRCLAYGDGVVYWALAEMVRRRAGIIENEPTESAREKLGHTVEEFVEDEADRRWVEARLSHLIGLQDAAVTDPRDLFAAWRFFFERLATRELTVLVFEDLQWADSALLDFIEYLMEWSRNSPILVLTLARPEISERRPGWGVGKRGLTSLYLEPLSRDSMEALLTGLVPGLPIDVRNQILERAAGVPLYAVETVRMLLDRGMLVEDSGAFRVRGSLESLAVPESLHALIASRLDSLPPDERSLLQDAAVLGKSFTADGLSAVSGRSTSDLSPQLSALVNKDLLSLQSDPRSPERGQYIFVQDLIRTVARETLSKRDRKARHLAAAAYLETSWVDEDDIADVIAAHLSDAYQADTAAPDAAEIRERACRALVRAGEHAASLAAPASAQRYFERALELSGDDARAGLHERAGEAALFQRNLESARHHYRAGISLYEQTGNIASAARATVRLALIDLREGHLEEAETPLERAIDILDDTTIGDEERGSVLAEALAQLGATRYFGGDLDSALRYIERALKIAERSRLYPALPRALDVKSWILMAAGRWQEALILAQGALQVAATEGSQEYTAVIELNLAETLAEMDQPDASIVHSERSEETARRRGDRTRIAYAYLVRLPALLELGRWRECDQLCTRYAQEDADDFGSDISTTSAILVAVWLDIWTGRLESARHRIDTNAAAVEQAAVGQRQIVAAARAALCNAQGEHGEALTHADGALRAALERSFPIVARKALIEGVEAALALDNDAKAQELLQLARNHFPPGAQPSVEAHIQRWQARLAGRRHDVDEVEPGFKAALEAFTSLRRPFWLAVTSCEFAEWLITQGRSPEAEPHLAEARTIFEELGAAPWLARLNTLSPGLQAIAQ